MSANVVYLCGTMLVRAVARDMSGRDNVEKRLSHSIKMEALARLAGGVAHDFNNLLVGVLGYSSLLTEKVKETDPLFGMVREIHRTAIRARDLTTQLLSFSRGQVLPMDVLDLNLVVGRAETLLHRILGEGIELVYCLESTGGRVRANSGQIEQVIVNLTANARDAMPTGGTLTIRTADVLVDQSAKQHLPQLIPGEYVSLNVSDTGCGMDSETLSHIFEPLYTTKAGVGAGLGLSTVYGIVKQTGGYILVNSQLGKGTSFEIYFPQVKEQGNLFQFEEQQESAAEPSSQSGTVLVVDDEGIVRSLAGEVLKAHGYHTFYVKDGTQAIAIAHAHQGPIHLLITDVMMPRMNGHRVAEEFLKLNPTAKVLYMSGYPDTKINSRTQPAGNSFFLQKPFTAAELYRRVREILSVC